MKLAQSVVSMQKIKSFYLSLEYGHGIISYRRVLTLFLVMGLASCSTLKASNLIIGSNVTPIREIIKPEQDKQTIVYVQGKVEKEVPLIQRRAYQINDSTGKIWVVTNQANLKEGAPVVIKGKLRYQSIPLAGQEFGEVYIEEE
jgi:hypothetical protein